MSEPIDLRPVPGAYFRLISRRFGRNEELRAAIFEGVDIDEDELDDPDLEINFCQQMRQVDNLNRLLGQEWILDVPEAWSPEAHGAIGVAIMSAPSIGAAAETLAKYLPVHISHQRLRLFREADSIVLRHGMNVPVTESQRQTMVELFFLALANLLGWPLGAARSELRFEFSRTEPRYAERLGKALGGQVRWGADADAMIVPKRLLKVRSPVADPVMHHTALERVEQARRSTIAAEGLKGRVERLLAHSGAGRVSSDAAAQALGLSRRTLVRRLASAGLNYRDLVDAELKARARRLLDEGVLSRAEIGERLGFADATGFSRACRRWFKADA
jgi:AraC-like DNA-binding protein